MESKTQYKKPNQNKQISKQEPLATHSYEDIPNQYCFYTTNFRY